jgi:hypothetical protein
MKFKEKAFDACTECNFCIVYVFLVYLTVLSIAQTT